MSLKGNRYAYELAEMGACCDTSDRSKISCYVCDFKFEEKEIEDTKHEFELKNARDAGWLLHTSSHPWCEYLKNLPEEVRTNILGKRIFHIIYVCNI